MVWHGRISDRSPSSCNAISLRPDDWFNVEVNMQHLLRYLLIATLAATQTARLAHGQATQCPYDACALRLHRGSLVQGMGATRVARLCGWFSAARIDVLATAGDSTRRHYLAFRDQYHRGAMWRTAGLALVMASAIVTLSDPRSNHYYVPVGLAVLSLPVSSAGRSREVEAWDQLQQAIWFYNRDLPKGP